MEKDVAAALLAAGFSKINKDKFRKRINPETEVFVYPGVRSRSGYLMIDPVAGLENAVLTSRLKALDKKQDTRVCHFLPGNMEDVRNFWNGEFSLYAAKGEPTADIVQLFVAALDKLIIPKLAVYDSTEKVMVLLRAYIEDQAPHAIMILDAPEKLALLTNH